MLHGPQFGEFGHESNRNHGADPFGTLEQVALGPPEGTVLDGTAQALISISQFLFQPADVCLDSLTDAAAAWC
jgi:hypothetical protein